MIQRRHSFDYMCTVDQPRWLVVSNMSGRILSWMELAPRENLRKRFAEAVAAAYAAGWEAEEFDSRTGKFFCRRGDERRLIGIQPEAPADRSGLWRVPEETRDVSRCVNV